MIRIVLALLALAGCATSPAIAQIAAPSASNGVPGAWQITRSGTGVTQQQWFTGGFPRLTIDGIGNVGVGDPDPEAPLAVAGGITVSAGSVNVSIDPTSGTATTLGNMSSHPLNLVTSGTTRLSIGATGDIAAASGYAPASAQSLATKAYVDASAGGGGNIGAPVTHTSATVSLAPTDVQVHLIDAAAAAVMVNLPDAGDGTAAGKVFTVKKIDGSANGVDIDGGEANIDGQASQGLASQYSVLTAVFDGTNWQVLSRNGS